MCVCVWVWEWGEVSNENIIRYINLIFNRIIFTDRFLWNWHNHNNFHIDWKLFHCWAEFERCYCRIMNQSLDCWSNEVNHFPNHCSTEMEKKMKKLMRKYSSPSPHSW